LEYEHPTVGNVKTTGFPVSFSETPQKIYKPAPLLNQHASEILKEYCNYTEEEIQIFQKT
jgi:crotonobetainyl-CoA:carnitine CoA-transferase CaiB-like acyl-CoA transferase